MELQEKLEKMDKMAQLFEDRRVIMRKLKEKEAEISQNVVEQFTEKTGIAVGTHVMFRRYLSQEFKKGVVSRIDTRMGADYCEVRYLIIKPFLKEGKTGRATEINVYFDFVNYVRKIEPQTEN